MMPAPPRWQPRSSSRSGSRLSIARRASYGPQCFQITRPLATKLRHHLIRNSLHAKERRTLVRIGDLVLASFENVAPPRRDIERRDQRKRCPCHSRFSGQLKGFEGAAFTALALLKSRALKLSFEVRASLWMVTRSEPSRLASATSRCVWSGSVNSNRSALAGLVACFPSIVVTPVYRRSVVGGSCLAR